MLRIVYILVILSLSTFRMYGQCSFPIDLAIIDDSTSTYSINITGAVDNDLGTNGICAIRVKFRHSTVGETAISLVSPFGQTVQLIGPTTPFSNITDFTTWDITFNQCGNPVSPDFGFSPVFNTLQPWGQFGSYAGSYYPNMGCLQDFNIGTINGTWSIVVSDVSLFDDGIIEEFQIFFCDDTGVSCSICEAFPADIVNQDIIVCQGDSSLSNILSLDYNRGVSNPLVYAETFMVFNDGQIVDYSNTSNFRSLSPGVYDICHTVYQMDQSLLLPPVGSVSSPESINLNLSQLGLCAGVSEDCYKIEILSPTASTDVFVEVCEGDSIFVFGTYFSNEGIFPLSKGGAICDSLFLINVDVIELNPTITPSQPEISCDVDSIILTASNAEVGKIVTYKWYTPDGSILSDANLPSITIDTIGTYIVEADYNGCLDYDTIMIQYANDIPLITLRADTLTCLIDAATITISSSIPLVIRDWEGPGVVAEGSFTIKADVPGIYSVVGTDASGCKGSATIELIGDIDPPLLTYDVVNINCKSDSASILINGIEPTDTIRWINPSGFGVEDVLVYPTIAGQYFLESVSDNGCNNIDTIEILDERYTIDVAVIADTIFCGKLNSSPVAIPNGNIGDVSFEWFRGIFSVSTQNSPTFIRAGNYSVMVTDTNLCTGMSNFVIEVDTTAPILLVEDTIFFCITDSIQIGILNPQSGFSYRWRGPFNFSSVESNPYIFNDGEYDVEVTTSKGCVNNATIVVIEGPDLPKSNFNVGIFDCFNDTARIIPDNILGFDFEWSGPGLITPTNDPNAVMTEPGQYVVTITQISDNCKNAYDFEIGDLRTSLDIESSFLPLDCKTDTIIPSFTISDAVVGVSWSGPVADENILNTKISSVGEYIVSLTDINGCITNDTLNVGFDGDLPIITTQSNTIICQPNTALQTANSPRGESYIWKLNNEMVSFNDSIMVSEAGDYTVIVEDENGCTDSVVVEVVIDTIPPDIMLVLDNIISCDDSISVISAGLLDTDLTYNWSGPTVFVDNVNSIEVNGGGVFSLETQNSRGCISFDTINVSDIRVIPDFEFNKSDIDCNGDGSIDIINAENTAILRWTGPQSIGNDVYNTNIDQTGTFTVIATSALGCDFVREISIGIDTISPLIENIILDTITCFQPIIEIGFNLENQIDSIIWDGAIETSSQDSFIQITDKGIYNAIIVGENGCTTISSITVEEDIEQPNSIIIGDTLTCLKSKLPLALSNYDNVGSVTWTVNSITSVGPELFINAPGEYFAKIVGENGCITTDSIQIIEDKRLPIIDIQDTFYLPCNGDPLQLSLESDIPLSFYRWIGATYFSEEAMPLVLDAGQLFVFAAGANGCNTFDSTEIVLDNRPIDFGVSFDTITCKQPFAIIKALRVDDDESFFWVYPDGAVTNTEESIAEEGGIYKLIVNRGNNCIDSLSFEIAYDTVRPEASIVYTENYQCNNTIVDMQGYINADRNTIISDWSTLDGTFVDGMAPPVSSEGTYRFTVVDTINGCADFAEQIIAREPQSLVGLDFTMFDPLCLGDENGEIIVDNVIGGFGSINFNIDGGEFTEMGMFDSLRSGDYLITAVDSFGCELDTLINLFDGLYYEVTIVGDTVVALGDSTLLTFESDVSGLIFDSIAWVNRDSIVCADCEETYILPSVNNFYTITTVSEEGCIAKDSILIRVDSDFELDMPNIFSPNGDGSNDVFKLSELKGFDEVLTFMIFDRWGNVMHQEYDINIADQRGWDGNYDGRYALPGVYVVLMEVRLKNGAVTKKTTDLTLIR